MREGNGRGARATPIPHRGSTPHASAIDARLASLPSLTSPPQKITTMKNINPPRITAEFNERLQEQCHDCHTGRESGCLCQNEELAGEESEYSPNNDSYMIYRNQEVEAINNK